MASAADRRKVSGRRLNPNFNPGVNGVVLGNAAKSEEAVFKGARYTGKLDLSNRKLTTVPQSVFAMDESADAEEKWWMMVETRELDLSGNMLTDLPPQLCERLEQLEGLNVSHNALESLKLDLPALPQLKRLDMSHNKLGAVEPRQIFSTTLVVLSLGGNMLTELPALLLPELEVLDIASNAMETLPELSGMPRLKRLLAGGNRLAVVPDLSVLPLLEVAELQKNELRVFPPGLESLRHLGALNLSYNAIEHGAAVPPQLNNLSLGFNRLADLDALKLGGALSVLDCRDNRLASLPESLFACASLKFLELSNNDLVELPPGLGYLPMLQQLGVDGNKLRSIRRTLLCGSTDSLKKYLRTRGPPPGALATSKENTSDNRVGVSPATAVAGSAAKVAVDQTFVAAVREAQGNGTLALCGASPRRRGRRGFCEETTAAPWTESSLAQLLANDGNPGGQVAALLAMPILTIKLCGNSLTRIGTELSQSLCGFASNLCALDLSENSLTVLPPELAALPNLAELGARKNEIGDDGTLEFAGALTSSTPSALRTLDLGQNRLCAIPAALLSRLPCLEELNLAYNRIVHDEPVLADIGALTKLDLSNNKLTAVPSAAMMLPNLRSLNLENNDIHHVPPELGLKPLHALLLGGNPLRSLRPAIVRKGTAAVLAYLRDRIPS